MKLLAVAILVLALLSLGTDCKRNKVHPKKEKGKKKQGTTIQPVLERQSEMQSVISAGICDDGYYYCVAGPAQPGGQWCVPSKWLCEDPMVCDCWDCADEHYEQCVDGTLSTAATATTTAASTTTTASGGGGQCGQSAPIYPPKLSIFGGEIMGLTYSIVGGDEATPHSYPWMVRLRMQSQPGEANPYVCGGSLISNQWILTAAHCVYDTYDGTLFAQIKVLLGAHNTRNSTNWLVIDNVIPHPYYKKRYGCSPDGIMCGMTTMDNDVALLKLPAPVVFNDEIKPICLPDATSDYRLFQGKVVAAGWGGTEAYVKPSPQSDVLKHLVLSVLGCDSQGLSPMRMCAVSTGVPGSICGGDSGSPLAALVGGRFTQLGVVSYGPHGCEEGNTNTYAHVPNVREWIRQETGV